MCYRHRVSTYRHRVPELQAPVWIGNMCYRHRMSTYRHRVPELQAPVSFGNMCFRHRTPFRAYIIIKEGGGVVPEVVHIDFSIVVTDDTHTGPVWVEVAISGPSWVD